MSARRSSPTASAAQNTHAASGPPAVETYAIRQGAQSCCTRLGVDELAEALADLEERNGLLRDAHAVTGLGGSPPARVTVADAEAPEAPQLDPLSLTRQIP